MVDVDVKVLFGERVRELRQKRGWSQEEFAAKAELDRSYVGCIERGERNVSIENIARIASALGVSPASLFEWRGKQ
jgi:transcriptional regulator with XRE-family HTH domain